jgi:hypothetical protein
MRFPLFLCIFSVAYAAAESHNVRHRQLSRLLDKLPTPEAELRVLVGYQSDKGRKHIQEAANLLPVQGYKPLEDELNVMPAYLNASALSELYFDPDILYMEEDEKMKLYGQIETFGWNMIQADKATALPQSPSSNQYSPCNNSNALRIALIDVRD